MSALSGSTAVRALVTAAFLAYLASTIDMGETARALARLTWTSAAIVILLRRLRWV